MSEVVGAIDAASTARTSDTDAIKTHKDYCELVSKQAAEFKRQSSKLVHWDDWLESISAELGLEAKDLLRKARDMGVPEAGRYAKHIRLMFAVHYRLHAEFSYPGYAKEIDDRVFRKPRDNLKTRPVFEKRKDSELKPTFPKNIYLPPSYQSGRPEFDKVKDVLRNKTAISVALTAAVRGAGGYGKTAIAEEICLDREIRGVFQGGIYWLQFGMIDAHDGGAAQRFVGEEEAVNRLLISQYGEEISRKHSGASVKGFCQLLAEDEPALIIADDLWRESQHRWISELPPHITVLFTSRDRALSASRSVEIERLSPEAAYSLISYDVGNLSQSDIVRLHAICRGFKGWPLLIEMANGKFRALRAMGINLEAIFERFEGFLKSDDIDGWDNEGLSSGDRQTKRRRLVGVCMEVGMDAILTKDERYILPALGVFPEDTDIPLSVAVDYWIELSKAEEKQRVTEVSGYDRLDLFRRFSFFRGDDLDSNTFRFHDEVLAYLRQLHSPEELEGLNATLVQSIRKRCPEGWDSLPSEHRYGWRHIHRHLEQSGQAEIANELRTDFKWIKAKLEAVGVVELEETYSSSELDHDAQQVRNAINVSALALQHQESLAHQMYGRLGHNPNGRLVELVTAAKSDKFCWPTPIRPHLDPPGSRLRTLTHRHSQPLSSAVFNHDGSRIVTASKDGTACVWDTVTGEPVNASPMKHDDWVSNAVFNHDGSRVVTASGDGTTCVWDTVTGGQVNASPMKHGGSVNSAVFNHDGSRVVTASDDRTGCVWNTVTGERVNVSPMKHGSWVNSAVFNHDSSRVVTASEDGTIGLWNVGTGDRLALIDLDSSPSRIDCNGKLVIALTLGDVCVFQL